MRLLILFAAVLAVSTSFVHADGDSPKTANAQELLKKLDIKNPNPPTSVLKATVANTQKAVDEAKTKETQANEDAKAKDDEAKTADAEAKKLMDMMEEIKKKLAEAETKKKEAEEKAKAAAAEAKAKEKERIDAEEKMKAAATVLAKKECRNKAIACMDREIKALQDDIAGQDTCLTRTEAKFNEDINILNAKKGKILCDAHKAAWGVAAQVFRLHAAKNKIVGSKAASLCASKKKLEALQASRKKLADSPLRRR